MPSAAACTPGSASTLSSTDLKKARRALAVLYFTKSSDTTIVITRSVRNPPSTCCSLMKLRTSRPGTTSTTNGMADHHPGEVHDFEREGQLRPAEGVLVRAGREARREPVEQVANQIPAAEA